MTNKKEEIDEDMLDVLAETTLVGEKQTPAKLDDIGELVKKIGEKGVFSYEEKLMQN